MSLAPLEGTAGDAAPLLLAAAEGASPRGHVLVDGKLHYAAAAPAGDGRGVLVLAPVGEAFARGVAVASGLPVLLVAPGAKPIVIGNLPTADQPVVVEAARVIGVRSDAGRLGPVDLGGGGAMAAGAMKLPNVPLLGGAAPAYRVHAVGLEGVKGAAVIAAAPTAPRLAPIAVLQWQVVAALAVALVLAALFGLLVRAAEPPPMLPESLVSAAARIEKGDFGVRVPDFAGQLGTISAALDRATKAAFAMSSAPPAPVEEAFARAARPAEADPSAFEFLRGRLRPTSARRRRAAPRTAQPSSHPRRSPRSRRAPRRSCRRPPADEPLAAPAELLQAAAQSAPPEDDEQGHWRQVFSDFLRTRGECGEPAGGVTFERFAQKLASNKAALVSKYACRTVRFQVYVKDGKAALKATPVR